MMPHDLHHFFVGQHVFVTGASGFIGGHVASLLIQAGAHVRALTRSTKGGYDSAIDWLEPVRLEQVAVWLAKPTISCAQLLESDGKRKIIRCS